MLPMRERLLTSGHGAVFRLRRISHRARLPELTPSDAAILAALEAEGAYATDLATLAIPGSEAMLAAADRLMVEMADLPRRADGKDYVVMPSPEHAARHPDLVRWGLDERLLAIAEHYIGLPVTYRGVLARLDFPDGTVRETRLWHLDQEDHRILKIVVYLDTVDDAGGPFEYIPASRKQPRYLAKGPKLRIDNPNDVAAVTPADQWVALTGRRGTVGFVDTCRVFHRGRLPTARARKSLFFAYNSRSPMRPSHCTPLFAVEKFLSRAAGLTARQSASLDFNYRR